MDKSKVNKKVTKKEQDTRLFKSGMILGVRSVLQFLIEDEAFRENYMNFVLEEYIRNNFEVEDKYFDSLKELGYKKKK